MTFVVVVVVVVAVAGHTEKRWDDGTMGQTTGQFMPVNWPVPSSYLRRALSRRVNNQTVN